MVFKTICVGSIPAILVIVNFSALIKKPYTIKHFGTKTVKKPNTPKAVPREKSYNLSATRQNKNRTFGYKSRINLYHPKPNSLVSKLGPSTNLLTNAKHSLTGVTTAIAELNYVNAPITQRNLQRITTKQVRAESTVFRQYQENAGHPSSKARASTRIRRYRHSAWS
jgi:hypothetical protein